MSDLGVVEHGDLVAGIVRGNEDSVREAIGAPAETPVQEPRVSESAKSEGESDGPSDGKPADTLTPFRKGAKPRDDAFARMKQATDQAKEAKTAREAAEQRASALEARIRELESRPAAPTRQPDPAKPEPPKPQGPKFEFPGFDAFVEKNPQSTYEDWHFARTEAYADWREGIRAQQYQQYQRNEELRTTFGTHLERVQAAKAIYPDWDSVMDKTDAILKARGISALPDTLMDAIIRSDRSADLLYFLGTHPEQVVDLTHASADLPVSAARFIRESLERQLGPSAGASTGSAAVPKQSRASAPPSPVKGSPTATASGGLDGLTPDEAIERYKKTKRFT